MMNTKGMPIVIVLSLCIFGFIGVQSLYSIVISITQQITISMTSPSVEFWISAIDNIFSVVISIIVVIGIWKRCIWVKIVVAVYTLFAATIVLILPLLEKTIKYEMAYLISMFVFVGPIILFNIYFLKSRKVSEFLTTRKLEE